MKKKIVFFTNCQGPALIKTLMESASFSSKYEVIKIPPVHTINSGNWAQVRAAVIGCDVLVYQVVRESSSRLPGVNSNYIKLLVPKNALKISFPSIYFDAFTPHIGIINRWESPLKTMHDYFVAYCWYIGLTVEETSIVINHPNLFLKTEVDNIFAQSVDSLQMREERGNVDIKVSGFLKKNFKTKYLMHKPNHPGRLVLNFVAEELAKLLHIKLELIIEGPEYLGTVSPKLLPSIKEKLGLDFYGQCDQYNYSPIGEIKELEFIQGCFFTYENNDRDELLTSIVNKKFVMKNVMRLMPEVITSKKRRKKIESITNN